MVFMTLKTIVFKNEKRLFNFAFFVSLLPSLVNYRSHMTILSSREGSGVQNLRLYIKTL